MDEDVIVRRGERGLVSVLTMEYRPYNLLGPTLIGAIAAEVTAAQEAGSRAILLRSGLRHFSAGADVNLFDARIEQGGRREAGDQRCRHRPGRPLSSPRTFPRFPPENEVRSGLSAGGGSHERTRL